MMAWQPTAAIADACLRVGAPLRVAPAGLAPVAPGDRLVGRARPVRHHGSVDVFLEAIEGAARGDVLVIDNGGRRDEACVGDLVVVEASSAGLAGLVVWGLHRDAAEIRGLGLPVFSYGALPSGPTRAPPSGAPEPLPASVDLGGVRVRAGDAVFADEDGAVFVDAASVARVVEVAGEIRRAEAAQRAAVRAGRSLRSQLAFDRFLEARRRDPSLTFRAHLRRVGGAVEE